ncbi:hypothetical protein RUM43_009376 [Polyplax serrata]|uniref:Uncharacterized protein n=1 Tax=Polyplax serrata TaxID=468196 RepID=A0AAN8RUC8_POLSC
MDSLAPGNSFERADDGGTVGDTSYTGYRDRPQEERQVRFQNGCREGHTEIAFVATGTNIQLVFNPASNGYSTVDLGRECDFDKEHGKVSLRIPVSGESTM